MAKTGLIWRFLEREEARKKKPATYGTWAIVYDETTSTAMGDWTDHIKTTTAATTGSSFTIEWNAKGLITSISDGTS